MSESPGIQAIQCSPAQGCREGFRSVRLLRCGSAKLTRPTGNRPGQTRLPLPPCQFGQREVAPRLADRPRQSECRRSGGSETPERRVIAVSSSVGRSRAPSREPLAIEIEKAVRRDGFAGLPHQSLVIGHIVQR